MYLKSVMFEMMLSALMGGGTNEESRALAAAQGGVLARTVDRYGSRG